MLPIDISIRIYALWEDEMTLLDQIERCWHDSDAEARSCKWAKKLAASQEAMAEATKLFNEWKPLDVYTCVADATKSKVTIEFSLRYCGQEVARLSTSNQFVSLKVSEKTAKNNATNFGTPPDLYGEWDWRSAEATEFRRQFREASSPAKLSRVERQIEAAMIRQMLGNSNKFAGTLRDITPVQFAGCPFQFPMPLSANKGYPDGKKGNIDILARRGRGAANRLSVWELKAPGEERSQSPLEQAYIYSVTLLKMLRSSCGATWFRDVLGYERSLPEKISIESVAVVSPSNADDRMKFLDEFAAFKNNNCWTVGNDEVVPMVAFYQADTLSIELLP